MPEEILSVPIENENSGGGSAVMAVAPPEAEAAGRSSGGDGCGEVAIEGEVCEEQDKDELVGETRPKSDTLPRSCLHITVTANPVYGSD